MTRLVALAAFQLLTVLGLAGYHEYVWRTAPSFRIPLAPRDPFDLLRGRYFALNPADRIVTSASGQVPQSDLDALLANDEIFGGEAEVGFCLVESLHRVCALRRLGATEEGTATYWSRAYLAVSRTPEGTLVEVNLHLDRFFIPDQLELPAKESDPGWELEVLHRPGHALLPRRLFYRGEPLGQ